MKTLAVREFDGHAELGPSRQFLLVPSAECARELTDKRRSLRDPPKAATVSRPNLISYQRFGVERLQFQRDSSQSIGALYEELLPLGAHLGKSRTGLRIVVA